MALFELVAWGSRAVSFFNTIALLWLGLTVLLNAKQQRWGAWLAGGGLLLSGFVFAVHSALVAHRQEDLMLQMERWWRAGWVVFVLPPLLWYAVMAWYTGRLQRRIDRIRLVFMVLWGTIGLALLTFTFPLPSFSDVVLPSADAAGSIGTLVPLLLVYPAYSFTCMVLSLAVLWRPAATGSTMGDTGRMRAIPWLRAAGGALLCVSLLVAVLAVWFLLERESSRSALQERNTVTMLLGVDLLLSGAIAVSVVLMGRAIVSYEIFTGKTLPRRGLFLHWAGSLLLAAGFGVAVAMTLGLQMDPNTPLVFATVLMTASFALLGWRSYSERERSIEQLRPFVTGPRLYEQLLSPANGLLDSDVAETLRALCEEVLGARLAFLAPLGPLASLVARPVAYPPGRDVQLAALATLPTRLMQPQVLCVPVDPGDSGGAVWAVPLWSERGLIGALLLGEKGNGGQYTQEEIEIARASGERLMDMQASAELAHRLMALQRRRMAESQVVDQRARRVLHDDVLPRLHTTLLAVSGAQPEAAAVLAEIHHQIANLLRSFPAEIAPELAQLGLLGALRRELEGEVGSNFERVTWRLDAGADEAAASLPALAAEVVFGAAREAIRNAARHGRGSARERALHLTVTVALDPGLRLCVEDDGVGIAAAHGQTGGGAGHGLALHGTMMAVLGGTLIVESLPECGTRVTLEMAQTPVVP